MEGCECCRIGRHGGEGYQKIVVKLEGGWVLNHCKWGERTYLGYLILQTKEHREDIGDLHPKEVNALGNNLKLINCQLREYWAKIFSEDPIELVHVAYLNETPHINRHIYLSSKIQLLRESHVHMHLLTRTKKMGEALGYCAEKIGWHLLDNVDKFPDKYKVSDKDDKKVIKLMNYLNNSLGI